MPEYRIFTLTKERRIAGPAEIIDCASDKQAIDQAKILMDGSDIEVWQGKTDCYSPSAIQTGVNLHWIYEPRRPQACTVLAPFHPRWSLL